MVGPDDDQLVGQHVQVLQDLIADDRVLLELVELLICQPVRLGEDRIGDVDLAEIVQEATPLEAGPGVLVAGCVVHLARDLERVSGHPLGMAGRVRILGVDQRRHRGQGFQDHDLALAEEAGVVDGDRSLCTQLGDDPLVVLAKGFARHVVGEEEDADRLAPQGQRNAENGLRIEGPRAARLVRVVHERLAAGEDVLTDLAAQLEGQPASGLRVGAERRLDLELPALVQGKHADLGLAGLGRGGQDLLQDFLQVQCRRHRGQSAHQVLELPDHAVAAVEELGVLQRDDRLVGERGDHA